MKEDFPGAQVGLCHTISLKDLAEEIRDSILDRPALISFIKQIDTDMQDWDFTEELYRYFKELHEEYKEEQEEFRESVDEIEKELDQI
jgi:hypothetical protein